MLPLLATTSTSTSTSTPTTTAAATANNSNNNNKNKNKKNKEIHHHYHHHHHHQPPPTTIRRRATTRTTRTTTRTRSRRTRRTTTTVTTSPKSIALNSVLVCLLLTSVFHMSPSVIFYQTPHSWESEVWSKDFGSRLGIRPKSQHAQCAVCVRHRRLLKRLANDARGRSAQMQRYMKHLGRQYRDRTFYWKSRASSRLTTLPDGSKTVCLITDAMDHSKFRFPRTALAASKEFSGFIRPTLDMSAVICHGHHVLLCCSLPHLKKDASWCCDLICHSLHLLGAKMDMREFEVICQSDNTSREVKNNVTARLFGTLVGLHKVKRMELRCLASGHSHEDVDQYFSAIGSEIERHQELATPDCFVQMLQAFHDREGGIRVHEPLRICQLVGATRDWSRGYQIVLDAVLWFWWRFWRQIRSSIYSCWLSES